MFGLMLIFIPLFREFRALRATARQDSTLIIKGDLPSPSPSVVVITHHYFFLFSLLQN